VGVRISPGAWAPRRAGSPAPSFPRHNRTVGAFVGYLIFTRALGIGDNDAFDLGGLLSATIGVVLVLLAAGFFLRRSPGGRHRAV
jgi:hypothetical protein